jgi:hypothetical protein
VALKLKKAVLIGKIYRITTQEGAQAIVDKVINTPYGISPENNTYQSWFDTHVMGILDVLNQGYRPSEAQITNFRNALQLGANDTPVLQRYKMAMAEFLVENAYKVMLTMPGLDSKQESMIRSELSSIKDNLNRMTLDQVRAKYGKQLDIGDVDKINSTVASYGLDINKPVFGADALVIGFNQKQFEDAGWSQQQAQSALNKLGGN